MSELVIYARGLRKTYLSGDRRIVGRQVARAGKQFQSFGGGHGAGQLNFRPHFVGGAPDGLAPQALLGHPHVGSAHAAGRQPLLSLSPLPHSRGVSEVAHGLSAAKCR